MSWENNRLSISSLQWYRECPKVFDMTMSGKTGSVNKIVKNAAEFGIRAEAFWDIVFSENWFYLSDEKLEDKFRRHMISYPTEDSLKLRDGFMKCITKLRVSFKGDCFSEFEKQKTLFIEGAPYSLYGKLDYCFKIDNQVYIVDAKGTSARDKKHKAQVLHYVYMYWKLTDHIAKGILVYLRKGWVDELTYTEKDLIEYECFLKKEIAEIFQMKKDNSQFEPKTNKGCFLCGFSFNCGLKKNEDFKKDAPNWNTDIFEGETVL